MPIMNSVISGGGQQPSGTITITSNTTTNVAQYEYAVTAVPTTAPAHYIEKTVVNGQLRNSTNIINLNGVTDVGDRALAYAYYGSAFPANTTIDLSALTTVSGEEACQYMFSFSTGLTSANLSSLTTISGNTACNSMFSFCYGLTSANLSALTTISGNSACNSMFYFCSGLTSANLSALTTISGNSACGSMFYGCIGLTSANLSALTTCTDYACASMFGECTSLTTVYIGGTTAITFGEEPFNYMFGNCPQNIDVYAPAANRAEIEAMSEYPNFGGTGTVTWHWRS